MSPTIYTALLEFFNLLKKFSRYVLYCLNQPTSCVYYELMTTFLFFLFIVSMASDLMSWQFVAKSGLSLNIREL